LAGTVVLSSDRFTILVMTGKRTLQQDLNMLPGMGSRTQDFPDIVKIRDDSSSAVVGVNSCSSTSEQQQVS